MSSIRTYVVNKGDTLSKIARNNNISLGDLLKINTQIKDPNLIYVGEEINIEVEDVELQPTNEPNVEQVELTIEPEITQIEETEKTIKENFQEPPQDVVEEIELQPEISEIQESIELEQVEEPIEEEINFEEVYEIPENGDKISEMQSMIDYLHDNVNGDYKHLCGAYVSDQLAYAGLVDREAAKTSQGKNLARHIAENNAVIGDHQAIGYESDPNTQRELFDNIIDDNNGQLSNLIISFKKGGSFSSNAGHVMLIQEIKDGRVYFTDNWKKYRNNGKYIPTSLSVEEFKDQYLKSGNNSCYMTHIV